MTLEEVIQGIVPADQEAMNRAKARWDSIAKPLGSLGALEDAVIRIAGMTGSPDVDLSRRAVVVMCADNGVVAEGVTQTGQEVTWTVAQTMGAQRAGATKYGIVGSMVGTVLGLFMGIFGILFMPLIGAFVGEYIGQRDLRVATNVGWATWVGMLVGTALKLALSFIMIGIMCFALWF